MADLPQFEIPEAMREMAERNVEQARSAYGQFLEMARQAQDVVAKSSDTMAQSAREIAEEPRGNVVAASEQRQLCAEEDLARRDRARHGAR